MIDYHPTDSNNIAPRCTTLNNHYSGLSKITSSDLDSRLMGLKREQQQNTATFGMSNLNNVVQFNLSVFVVI